MMAGRYLFRKDLRCKNNKDRASPRTPPKDLYVLMESFLLNNTGVQRTYKSFGGVRGEALFWINESVWFLRELWREEQRLPTRIAGGYS